MFNIMLYRQRSCCGGTLVDIGCTKCNGCSECVRAGDKDRQLVCVLWVSCLFFQMSSPPLLWNWRQMITEKTFRL